MRGLPNSNHTLLQIFYFLLLMGGCAKKTSAKIVGMGSHNRPF
jgi:hypothetical protein